MKLTSKWRKQAARVGVWPWGSWVVMRLAAMVLDGQVLDDALD
jgi:hypothetical protein